MADHASENLGHAVVAVAWVFAAVATGVIAARLYVCLRILHKVSIDDYIIFLTLVRYPEAAVILMLTNARALVSRDREQCILDHLIQLGPGYSHRISCR